MNPPNRIQAKHYLGFQQSDVISYAGISRQISLISEHRSVSGKSSATSILLRSIPGDICHTPQGIRQFTTNITHTSQQVTDGSTSPYGGALGVVEPFDNSESIDIGYDAEWHHIGTRRVILSIQFSIKYRGVHFEWILFPSSGRRHPIATVLGWFFMALEAAGARVIDMQDLRTTTDEKRQEVMLIGHYSIVDFTAFSNGNMAMRQVDSIRGTLASVDKPLRTIVYGAKGSASHFGARISIAFRDSMLLSPTGAGSLAALGNALKMPKLDLPEGYKKNRMDLFLSGEPAAFILYAVHDAVISLEWGLMMKNSLNLDRVPITLGSVGARLARKMIMEENNWKVAGFDENWRGLVAVQKGEDGKAKRANSLVPSPSATHILSDAAACYMGGRNECFASGIHHGPWHDFDISSAYPCAMSLVCDPDYSVPQKVLPAGQLDLSMIDSPMVWMFAHVTFEFPKSVTFPCLPVKDSQGRGLIYPRTGEAWANGPEIWLALQMGASVILNQPVPLVATKASHSLAGVCKNLVEARNTAKTNHGKGSPQELAAKELVNSIYGKLGQGLAGKRAYSCRKDASNDVSPSIITSAPQAAMTTSLVRAFVSGAMEELACRGYRVASVTTDGFLTDAPREVVMSLEAFGFSAHFQNAKEFLGGGPIWEEKHRAESLVMMKTRGGFGVGSIENHALPTAGAGYKPSDKQQEKWAEGGRRSEDMAVLFLEREEDGKIQFSFSQLPNPKDYVRREADATGKTIAKSISWEFDLKRRPTNEREETVTIDGVTYTHVSFDTEAWQSIEEFSNARELAASMNQGAVKTVEKVTNFSTRLKHLEAQRNAGVRVHESAGGIRRTWAISVLRGLRSGSLRADWLAGMKGTDVLIKIGEAFDVKLLAACLASKIKIL